MALRSYRDPAGDEWRVWRVVPDSISFSTLGESYREGWLCFERIDGSDRRRLSMTQVPDGWDSLSDERLDQLRRAAESATRRSGAVSRIDRLDTGTIESEKRRD
jgi:hypothetical protein